MMGDELRLRHRCPSGRPPWEGTGHVIITGGSSEEVGGGERSGGIGSSQSMRGLEAAVVKQERGAWLPWHGWDRAVGEGGRLRHHHRRQ
jgi:hypothetical protein